MSAVDTTNAADALDREVRRLEQFSEAAKKLRELGSLEQAAEEAQKRLDILRSDEAEKQARVAKLEEGHAAVLDLIAQAKTKHHADAKALDEAVDRRAKEITEAASAQAVQIVGDAKLAAEATLKAARDYAEEIGKDAAEMKKAVDVGAQRVADLQAEYEDLTAKLDRARAQAAQILGAA